MKTINDMVTPDMYFIGWWGMWNNDILHGLDKLRIIAKKRVPVQFEATEYQMAGTLQGFNWWECQHAETYPDTITHYLDFDDSVEIPAEFCASCYAYFDERTEDWVND